MEGHIYMQWIVAIIVNLPLFTYGLLSGWVSPMTKILKSSDSPTGEPLTDNQISWIASCMCLSAVFGTPIYSYFADIFGRKLTTIGIAVLQLLTVSIKIFSHSTNALIVARIILGLASGGCFAVIPMYTKEISQDNIRGLLGSLLMLFQNIGFCIMYAIGSYLDYYTVLWITAVFPILNLFLLIKTPESPSFLVKLGKIDGATSALSLLRGLDKNDKVLQSELSQLRTDETFYKSLPRISYKTIFTDVTWRKSLILAAVMITVTSSNGNFAILTYATQILTTSGVTFSPELQSLSIPIVMIMGSLVTMTCVEKCGRKVLLSLYMLVAMASIGMLATILNLQDKGYTVAGRWSVVAIVVSVFANGAGIMPIPFIIMSETFNFQVRAKLMGTIVSYGWAISFFQLVSFGPISQCLGMFTMFYVYAAVNLIGVAFTLVFLPETRGKTVEEIEEMLRRKKVYIGRSRINK